MKLYKYVSESRYDSVIEIPENPTNGDMIKAMFPNGKVIERDEATGYEQMIDDKYSYCSWFDGIWWNSPYRKEQEWQSVK